MRIADHGEVARGQRPIDVAGACLRAQGISLESKGFLVAGGELYRAKRGALSCELLINHLDDADRIIMRAQLATHVIPDAMRMFAATLNPADQAKFSRVFTDFVANVQMDELYYEPNARKPPVCSYVTCAEADRTGLTVHLEDVWNNRAELKFSSPALGFRCTFKTDRGFPEIISLK